MAGRILRLSTTLNRTLARLGVVKPSPRHRALGAVVVSLTDAEELPVRRVPGFNLWVLYRFDETFLDVMSVRDQPPTPFVG